VGRLQERYTASPRTRLSVRSTSGRTACDGRGAEGRWVLLVLRQPPPSVHDLPALRGREGLPGQLPYILHQDASPPGVEGPDVDADPRKASSG
jgi:hypothetical protein